MSKTVLQIVDPSVLTRMHARRVRSDSYAPRAVNPVSNYMPPTVPSEGIKPNNSKQELRLAVLQALSKRKVMF